MLGLRGVRLGIAIPGLFEMQSQAILEAAAIVAERGRPRPAGDHGAARRRGRGAAQRSAPRSTTRPTEAREEHSVHLDHLVGTMIELPRAALTAGDIAEVGRLLLVRHQRPDPDDVGLLPRRRRVVASSRATWRPASSGCRRSRPSTGSGRRAAHADRHVTRAASAKPGLKVGVCGEHGGDPESVHYFEERRAGLRLVLALPRAGRPARGRSGGGVRHGIRGSGTA